MGRKARGFNRVTASREWNLARSNELHFNSLMAAKAQIERLQKLITAAAERAEMLGLAYPEFDALIDEVKSRPVEPEIANG